MAVIRKGTRPFQSPDERVTNEVLLNSRQNRCRVHGAG